MSGSKRSIRPDQRGQTLLARLRRRQLELAMQGRVADSAKVANRVGRVRRAAKPVAA